MNESIFYSDDEEDDHQFQVEKSVAKASSSFSNEDDYIASLISSNAFFNDSNFH